jgi:hypothetical protein
MFLLTLFDDHGRRSAVGLIPDRTRGGEVVAVLRAVPEAEVEAVVQATTDVQATVQRTDRLIQLVGVVLQRGTAHRVAREGGVGDGAVAPPVIAVLPRCRGPAGGPVRRVVDRQARQHAQRLAQLALLGRGRLGTVGARDLEVLAQHEPAPLQLRVGAHRVALEVARQLRALLVGVADAQEVARVTGGAPARHREHVVPQVTRPGHHVLPVRVEGIDAVEHLVHAGRWRC